MEAFTGGVVNSAEVTLAEVILPGTTGGAAVATAGRVVVMAGVAADHMVVRIAAVGTAVPIGMAAAGTGTVVVRIGTDTPFWWLGYPYGYGPFDYAY